MKTDSNSKLIFQSHPEVLIGGNLFVNIPVILKYEDVNMIEIVNDLVVGFTSKIPIYHPDGTQLAVAIGNRIFPTEAGKKANLLIEKYQGVWVCKLNNHELFEIHQQSDKSFKTIAELHTHDGYFIKVSDQNPLDLFNTSGNILTLGKFSMSNLRIEGFNIGIWMRKDGTSAIGVL